MSIAFIAPYIEDLGFHLTGYVLHIVEHVIQHGVTGSTRALMKHAIANQRLVLEHAQETVAVVMAQLIDYANTISWLKGTDIIVNGDSKPIDLKATDDSGVFLLLIQATDESGTELAENGNPLYTTGNVQSEDGSHFLGYNYAETIGNTDEMKAVIAYVKTTGEYKDERKVEVDALEKLISTSERVTRARNEALTLLATSTANIPPYYNGFA